MQFIARNQFIESQYIADVFVNFGSIDIAGSFLRLSSEPGQAEVKWLTLTGQGFSLNHYYAPHFFGPPTGEVTGVFGADGSVRYINPNSYWSNGLPVNNRDYSTPLFEELTYGDLDQKYYHGADFSLGEGNEIVSGNIQTLTFSSSKYSPWGTIFEIDNLNVSANAFFDAALASNTAEVWSQLLSGDDHMIGSRFDDVFGAVGVNPGNDHIEGQLGNDVIYGWDGSDQLEGGEGSDNLFGGSGNDYLDGGPGADGSTVAACT